MPARSSRGLTASWRGLLSDGSRNGIATNQTGSGRSATTGDTIHEWPPSSQNRSPSSQSRISTRRDAARATSSLCVTTNQRCQSFGARSAPAAPASRSRRSGVEIAGRLIRNQQRRTVDQRAGDRRPLLLAAAELMNESASPDSLGRPSQSARAPGLHSPRAALLARATGRLTFSSTFIVGRRLKNWKTRPSWRRRYGSAPRRPQCAAPRPSTTISPAVGCSSPAIKMHQRALAASARPADRDEFVPRDFQRDAVQRVHRALAGL